MIHFILPAYLEVPVNEVVNLKVLIVVAKWVEQCFGHLDPSHVAKQFGQGEEGYIEVGGMIDKGDRVREWNCQVWKQIMICCSFTASG